MKKIFSISILFLFFSCSKNEPLPSIIDEPEEELCPTCIWNEEFNGSSLNNDNWNFETGYGDNGWGNNEWQLYTNNNAKVVETTIAHGQNEYASHATNTPAPKLRLDTNLFIQSSPT